MKNLLKALFKFQSQVKPITKNADNPFFKSAYASHEHIQEHIKHDLIDCELLVVQPSVYIEGKEFVKTIVFHVLSGESMESLFPVVIGKGTAQDYGSSTTYAKRYSITGVLNLTIQGLDDDGEATMNRVQDTRAWLNKDSDQFKKALKYVQEGGSVAEIEKKYKISKEVKALLV